MIAHTRLGFAGEIASPIFPMTPVGSPRDVPSRRRQVVPPSVDLWMPEFFPPDDIAQGERHASQVAAYRMSGFDGSSAMSITPVESLVASTRLNVFPPSVVL